jgi:hypothetical protein
MPRCSRIGDTLAGAFLASKDRPGQVLPLRRRTEKDVIEPCLRPLRSSWVRAMKVELLTIAWTSCAASCGGAKALAPADASNDAAVSMSDVMVTATLDGAITDGSYGGGAEVRGTAGGQAFASHGAIGVSTQAPSDPSVPNLVTIGIPANFDLTCAQEKQSSSMNIARPSHSLLAFSLSAGGTPLVAGTYIAASNSAGDAGAMTASGAYTVTDANCSRVFQEMVTGGSVTVTAVDSTAISGSFELSFPNGDQLTGQFDAPLCYVFVRGFGAIVPPPPTCLH